MYNHEHGYRQVAKGYIFQFFLLKLGISADLKADGYFGPERERSRAHKFVRSAQESMERELLFVILKIQ
jgi:hypothetical protein